MAKARPKSPFTGSWHIVSMSDCDKEYLNEEEEAFIEFDERGGGSFHFGYVQGQMDCRLTKRDGEPAVEFSWDGNDEMESAQGRGSAILQGIELHGTIFFHEGDDSDFVAKKKRAKKR